jgi:NTP pyrophosphatase (non-canonical NTP hydrolase)
VGPSNNEHPLVISGVVAAVLSEYERAKAKHGENTLDGAASNDLLRLAALVEEVGEVAELLTYDNLAPGNTEQEKHRLTSLKAELIQVANVCVTWASIL